MAAAEKAKEAKKEEKQKREAPAVVRVSSRGQISRTLEQFADCYRERYPERDVRYVYDPTHKPELSGVLGRQASGYELVTQGELGLTGEDVDEEKVVRVGDLVLMSIDKESKKYMQDERTALAKAEAQRVQREFYHEVEQAAEGSTPSHHSGPAARPLGRAVIQEKEFEYDVKQRKE